MEEVLWWKGGMSISGGSNYCSTCLSGFPKWQSRQNNKATNEFWKRKDQICRGCIVHVNGVAPAEAPPAASSHEVRDQWHAAAVAADRQCRWSRVPAADPAVAVPPGLATQPPQPPPPPPRPPTVEVISEVMRTMQDQLARLEAQIEDADEVTQTMEVRLVTMEAASEDKDEHVKTLEERLEAMEAASEDKDKYVKTIKERLEAMELRLEKTDAQTKAREEADVPWGEKVGITADDENTTTWKSTTWPV